MKAARFHQQRDIRIEDIPEPETRPGTAKIKIAWCGICGTDLHEYLEGAFPPGTTWWSNRISPAASAPPAGPETTPSASRWASAASRAAEAA